MTYLARFLALIAISICADLALGQNATRSTVQKKPIKPSETAVEKSGEEKRRNLPALIFVKADRERIYALLAEQMKEQEFTLIQKDADRIVFSKRTPGAEAATIRKQFDRRVTTPIIDDPRSILAFVFVEKNGGYVVGGRMIVTTIRNSQVLSFDVSKRKEARMHLNKVLEKLKSDADIPQVTP
jgi:hypothetical protein